MNDVFGGVSFLWDGSDLRNGLFIASDLDQEFGARSGTAERKSEVTWSASEPTQKGEPARILRAPYLFGLERSLERRIQTAVDDPQRDVP